MIRNSKFRLCNPIEKSGKICDSPKESEKLCQYLNGRGGLVFAEFNTTYYGSSSRPRVLDAIRFPSLESGIYKARGNYEVIKMLLREFEVELIEVHKWGFYGLGPLIGKAEIEDVFWSTKTFDYSLAKDKKVLFRFIKF